jgi:hypothetical protein
MTDGKKTMDVGSFMDRWYRMINPGFKSDALMKEMKADLEEMLKHAYSEGEFDGSNMTKDRAMTAMERLPLE